jgi:phage baseplate assembly protein gpV
MAGNEGLLELNGKDIVQVIGEEAVPRSGDIDATTYNQKNYALSGSSYTITKDSPDVLYLELTSDFTFTITGSADTNRTIKIQIHKAASVASTTTITWSGVTEWLTDGNSAPVFGQVASTEQNLVIAICLSNTVVLANTLYNSESGVSGGTVSASQITGLSDAITQAVGDKYLDKTLEEETQTVNGNVSFNGGLTLNGGVTASSGVNFTGSVTVPTPTLETQAANKQYTDGKISLTGSRGQLAGYEQCATVTSLTLTDNSADSNYYNSTSAITVNDGTTGMSWTKTVKLTQVPASVNMTGNWTWVGGSAPTMVVNGLLVFTWQNNHGLINFPSPSA